MLKLDDHESVDGHSAGALRSLELDQPTYVGGVPYGSTEHSQLVNRTALMHLLGVQKLVGLDGCIKRFKLGHREVKIQSASEPLALRRISLNECQEGGTLHTATVSIRLGRRWHCSVSLKNQGEKVQLGDDFRILSLKIISKSLKKIYTYSTKYYF